MYKIVVVGLKQVYEAEYYKAYAVFYDFIRSTDYNVMLYRTVECGDDILLCSGGTESNGTKTYTDSTTERVRA